jgi:hypothetical protein
MNLVRSGFGTENGVSITISETAIPGEIIPGVELAAGNIFTYAETRFKIAEASTKKSPWATLWPVLRYFTRTISGPVSRFCFVPMSLRNSAGLIRSDLSNLSLAL